ncbi:MAG: MerR family transcriptional regulator [Eggerthellaceae bacterium]|nr:MerR family transcriptional regulator [Eggerthellaceae bacterium]
MDEVLADGSVESGLSKPQYAIGEVADMTGISAYTLRYYDKCGFFPHLYRDKNQVRSFSDNDVSWLRLMDALRKSGLSIEGIQYFVRLSLANEVTRAEQFAILENQETVLEYQLAEIQESLKVLQQEKTARMPQVD